MPLSLTPAGPCIRLSSAVTALFNRLHLVFHRSTEWTEKSLTTVILSRTMKRNFPHYVVSRTSNIFSSRQALLDFVAAIELQSEVDRLLEGVPSQEQLRNVRDILDRTYPLWEALVAREARRAAGGAPHEVAVERAYLRRFDAAWVYTRIIHKGAHVLGRLKEHRREHAVLSALLQQRFFQPARRGAWYQRKALVEENYMDSLGAEPAKASEPAAAAGVIRTEALKRRKQWQQVALDTCEAGLQDPQTHVIFHHDLQKRIVKLERQLRIPRRDRHDFGHALLRPPSERTIFGERLDAAGVGKKTLWRDPAGGATAAAAAVAAPCSVEEMCLATYRSEGWKGFHCEGGLVRTLFAYLFYDILFLYLPNVFETEFQTCPLDLFTDAFYPARASEINHRLAEIANGAARRLVRAVWQREHARATSVVGLDWSYSIDDLDEIVRCFPAEGLSAVCRVLCQEYSQRGSGLPDLFLWRMDPDGHGGECLFCEGMVSVSSHGRRGRESKLSRHPCPVKSENDRLSDTQRLWIHVLSSAGVRVELCAARARQTDPR